MLSAARHGMPRICSAIRARYRQRKDAASLGRFGAHVVRYRVPAGRKCSGLLFGAPAEWRDGHQTGGRFARPSAARGGIAVFVQALAEYADTYLAGQLSEEAFEEKPVQYFIELDETGTFLNRTENT